MKLKVIDTQPDRVTFLVIIIVYKVFLHFGENVVDSTVIILVISVDVH